MNLIAYIHGTFVRRASWFGPASTFRESFNQQLWPDGVEIIERTWSGGNRFSSRYNAAKSLRNRLGKDLPNYKRIFVIAHSHGGNIALNAVQTEPLNDVKIVTIGTPFLSLEKKDVSGFLSLIAGITLPALIFSTLASLFHADEYFTISIANISPIDSVVKLLLFVPLLLLVMLMLFVTVIIVLMIILEIIATLARLRRSERDRNIISSWETGQFTNEILCIYSMFDEAYILLKIYSEIIHVYYKLLYFGLVFIAVMGILPLFWDFKLGTIEAIFGEFGQTIALTPVPVSRWTRDLQPSYVAVNAVFTLSTLAVYFLVYAAYIALHFAFVLSDVSFGLADLPSALRSRIIVTREPRDYAGRVSVRKVRLGLRSWCRFRLNHTFLTCDDEVIAAVSQWIKDDVLLE
ncbi:hypothetical protein HFN97_20675 [Rhizobium laguerreae]|uniref:hypothetical protein n=1 Tax=Rhizobium laguerreae TaxID=1076926 RepID=UPI001C8FE887|nr:hypothetical protein [Rhizobium laguerreae]MBY3360213.1 hypothetical protein [Rhizobium laguerreae]